METAIKQIEKYIYNILEKEEFIEIEDMQVNSKKNIHKDLSSQQYRDNRRENRDNRRENNEKMDIKNSEFIKEIEIFVKERFVDLYQCFLICCNICEEKKIPQKTQLLLPAKRNSHLVEDMQLENAKKYKEAILILCNIVGARKISTNRVFSKAQKQIVSDIKLIVENHIASHIKLIIENEKKINKCASLTNHRSKKKQRTKRPIQQRFYLEKESHV